MGGGGGEEKKNVDSFVYLHFGSEMWIAFMWKEFIFMEVGRVCVCERERKKEKEMNE